MKKVLVGFFSSMLLLGCAVQSSHPILGDGTGMPRVGGSSPGLGGDGVGNGGYIGEKNVLLAYQTLLRDVKLCLASAICPLTSTERSLLLEIEERLSIHPPDKKHIQFGTVETNPQIFDPLGDGKAHGRSAATNFRENSLIWINRDHLQQKVSGSQFRPISRLEAAALLLHELGHQVRPHDFLNASDHKRLESLCAKFQQWLENKRQVLIHPVSALKIVVVNHASSEKQVDDLLFGKMSQMTSFQKNLAPYLSCGDKGERLQSGRVWNAHWIDMQIKNLGHMKYQDSLKIHLALVCASPEEDSRPVFYNKEVSCRFKYSKMSWPRFLGATMPASLLDPSALEVECVEASSS